MFSSWSDPSARSICMRVCPFNRSYDKMTDRLWRWFAIGRWRAGKMVGGALAGRVAHGFGLVAEGQ